MDVFLLVQHVARAYKGRVRAHVARRSGKYAGHILRSARHGRLNPARSRQLMGPFTIVGTFTRPPSISRAMDVFLLVQHVARANKGRVRAHVARRSGKYAGHTLSPGTHIMRTSRAPQPPPTR